MSNLSIKSLTFEICLPWSLPGLTIISMHIIDVDIDLCHWTRTHAKQDIYKSYSMKSTLFFLFLCHLYISFTSFPQKPHAHPNAAAQPFSSPRTSSTSWAATRNGPVIWAVRRKRWSAKSMRGTTSCFVSWPRKIYLFCIKQEVVFLCLFFLGFLAKKTCEKNVFSFFFVSCKMLMCLKKRRFVCVFFFVAGNPFSFLQVFLSGFFGDPFRYVLGGFPSISREQFCYVWGIKKISLICLIWGSWP